ncbi:MAG: UDP-3-O-(3-hydroxymyristoyl)glucosamine N-acyltransferase [Pseudomonadota bacterium]
MSYSLSEIVAQFGGELLDDSGVRITGVAPVERAGDGEIAFVSQAKYLRGIASSRAAALILPPEGRDACTRPRIIAGNPYLYFARVSALLNPAPRPAPGVHFTAFIHPQAKVAATATVGAGAVVCEGAVVGERSIVGPNSVVGEYVTLGDDCLLHANVTIYRHCVVGNRVILHSGCVIGSDGFGFADDRGRWVKIPQVGRVVLGDDVEVGAGTTIDRGTLDDTVIEEGVKLDNLIQVAHNVRIGAHTAIAACTGIAGSAKIGRHCMIGGAAMIFGHIEIADGVRISTNTLITKSLTKAGTYTSALPFSEHGEWLRNAAHLRSLDKLVGRIKDLEKRISELEGKK